MARRKTTAKHDNPALWNRIKAGFRRGAKGGEPGQWSARKAQLATQAYKRRGGGYAGEKRSDNSLKTWTEADWGTASGARSRDTGERYLPKAERERLSDEEYARTTAKKRQDSKAGRQYSRQPDDVRRQARGKASGDGLKKGGGKALAKEPKALRDKVLGADGAGITRKELMDLARKFDIPRRSGMSKDELRAAVRSA